MLETLKKPKGCLKVIPDRSSSTLVLTKGLIFKFDSLKVSFKEEMVNYRTYEKKSCMHWNLVNKRTHYLLGNILQSILTINPCNIYKPKWNCNNQGISNGLGSYNNLICLLNTRRTWLKKWLVISSFSTWNYWCLLLWNWRQLLITRCKPFSWG